MLYKHFENSDSNPLLKVVPALQAELSKMQHEVQQDHELNSDDLPSDTSGNDSETDEINIIEKLKQDILLKKEVSEVNEQEVSEDDKRIANLS